MKNENETSAGGLDAALAKYAEATSESSRIRADTGIKIIEAVREQLAAFPIGGGITEPGNEEPFSALGELTQNPSGLSQLLSLSVLAATVRWFSNESGRPETEILEQLATDFRNMEGLDKSIIEQVTRDVLEG